jgi:hypothetical protein
MMLKDRGEEDEARIYFEKAANLGSDLARKQSVAMNPYAQMCNQMMCQMMAPYYPKS